VRATVSLEGVPIHLIDTAGLRDARDEVERIGIERTWHAIQGAGAALFITSPDRPEKDHDNEILHRLPQALPIAHIHNKIDLAATPPGIKKAGDVAHIGVSAKTGAGIESLRRWLLDAAGWRPHGEALFVARERHLQAMTDARSHLQAATHSSQPFELMAEELRLAQRALNRITGEVSADELLGEIFSRFCIGK
jgi:tRNA modification GTPase